MESPGRGRARTASAPWPVALALVVMCAAAGCETSVTDRPAPPAGTPAPGTPSLADRPGAIMPASPDAENAPTSPAPGIAALPVEPPPLPPPEPEVDSDPERLIGMAPEAVTDLLGPPAFVRNDAPSQLWRYRAPHCLLDLFLYESAGARPRATRVLHYTVQGNGDAAPSAENCLRTLLLARISKAAG